MAVFVVDEDATAEAIAAAFEGFDKRRIPAPGKPISLDASLPPAFLERLKTVGRFRGTPSKPKTDTRAQRRERRGK